MFILKRYLKLQNGFLKRSYTEKTLIANLFQIFFIMLKIEIFFSINDNTFQNKPSNRSKLQVLQTTIVGQTSFQEVLYLDIKICAAAEKMRFRLELLNQGEIFLKSSPNGFSRHLKHKTCQVVSSETVSKNLAILHSK